MTTGAVTQPEPVSQRSAVRAGTIGALLAGVVFVAILCSGHLSLLQRPVSAATFFDAQAHSLLNLRWDVPRNSLEIEGFLVDGKVYEYFGPLPALLRLPIAAWTDRFDGRLGQISMLLAFAFAMAFTVRLTSRLRPLVRGSAPVTRGEQWAVGSFTFAVGAGSVFTFLASRSWAYHEAELWGAAFALGALEFVIAFTLAPSRRHLVLASAFTTGALLSRGSVGSGPLVAFGLVLVAGAWPATRRVFGLVDRSEARSRVVPLIVAILIPIALWTYVNEAKFGTPFSLPFNTQISKDAPGNRFILAANGGTMLNPGLVPTTAVQYLGPKPLRLISLFPWVTFGSATAPVGNHTVAWTPTTSFPATMPLLTALGLVGLIAVVLPSRRSRLRSLAALRAPVVGGIVATIPTLSYAYIAQRYLSDFMPLAILLAIAGLHLLLRWTSGPPRRRLRNAVWVGVGLLTFASVWFNVGLAVISGRLLDGSTTKRDAAAFVGFQYKVHELLPGGQRPFFGTGLRLPALEPGKTFVLGRCAGLYWSDGKFWSELEGSERTGRFRLRVRFPTSPTGWEPLIVSRAKAHGRGDKPQYLTVRMLRGGRVQFAFDGVFTGRPIAIRPGTTHELEIKMDAGVQSRTAGKLNVGLDGRPAYSMTLPNSIDPERLRPLVGVTVGRADLPGLAPRFTGSITRLPSKTPICEQLTR